ncbi:MAG: hypothetical protein U9R21_04320 [Candidatus Thermoplasmatota archaeon]|nr:hypothetical protein [Candidatus Thermoplasmatota archaeon]
MRITVRSVDRIDGIEKEGRFHIDRATEITMLPENQKEVDELREFVTKYVPPVAAEKER